MDFNKRFYNIFAIVLVVLISMIIVFSTTVFSVVNSSTPDNENTIVFKPEEVTDSTKLKTFKSPQSALDSALKIYNDSNIKFHSKSEGDLDVYLGSTKVTSQKVYTEKIKIDNNTKFQISASRKKEGSIGITVYSQAFYLDNQIKLRKTDDISATFVPNKLSNWETLEVNEYKDNYGILPVDLNYLINKSSIKKFESFRDNITYYTVIVLLDPEIAGQDYKKQIKNLSGSNEDPVITSLKMTCNINKYTGAFDSIIYNETYSVNAMGINASCEMNYTEKFISYENVNLPDYLQEFIG